MNSLRAKLSVQFFISNAATVVSFALSLYLARILAPSEIGIYSIAVVLVGFVHVFRDFGVVSFIRSEKDLTPELLRTAMGVMITTSWTFAAVVFFTSTYAAAYYKQPGIEPIMRVLAIGFLFIPFGSVPQAVLGRNMDVKRQTVVTAVSTVAYAATCITLAKLNFSYMSFAWANLVNIIVCALTYSLLRPEGLPWLPSLQGWRRIVNFGGGTMLTNSIRAADAAVPDLMLGRLSGPQSVGLFSRANSTVNILNYITTPTIHFAALPYLAKVHHSGNDVSAKIRQVVTYMTGVIWPALAVTAVLATDLVDFLYGHMWLACATVIPLLCAANGIQMMFYVLQPSFTGVGRPYLVAFPLAVGVAMKFGAAMILFDGTLVSFAQAYLVGEIATIPIYLFLCHRYLYLSYLDWLQALLPSAVVAVLVGLVIWFSYPLLSSIEPLVARLGIAAALAGWAWLGTLVVVRHPLSGELGRVKQLFRKRDVSRTRAKLH